MNPVSAKLAIVLLDQVMTASQAWAQAKANPNMTDAEAEALIERVKASSAKLSDDWRALRQAAGDD